MTLGGQPSIDLILHGDGAAPDLYDKKVIYAGTRFQLIRMPGGMRSGRHSLILKIDLNDKTTVIVETSVRAFMAAAKSLQAAGGDGDADADR